MHQLVGPLSALSTLLLAAGCDPCADWSGMEIDDPDGAFSDDVRDEIRDAHDRWLDWTDSDAVCIDQVGPSDDVARWSSSRGRLWVTPDAGHATRDVYTGMCGVLDDAEGHSDARPDLFGADQRRGFADWCGGGPASLRWVHPIRAACGDDELADAQRYLVDEVYAVGALGRNDGDLHARPAGQHRAGIVLGDVVGARFLELRLNRHAVTPRYWAFLVDPLTGQRDMVWSGVVGGFPWAVGGRDGGALVFSGRAATVAVVLGVDGTAVELPVGPEFRFGGGIGVVGGDALWAASGSPSSVTEPIQRVDLATGAVTDVPLPAAPAGEGRYVSALRVVDQGLFVTAYTAVVEVNYDYVVIGVSGYEMWLFDPASGAWTLLGTGVNFLDAGVDSRGRVIGSVFSDAGRALAAYDLESDDLLISEDVCVGQGYPTRVTGDVVWQAQGIDHETVWSGVDVW